MAKYSTKHVAEIVEMDELGYTIQHGITVDRIANPELRDMFQRAKVLLDQIDEFLGPYYSEQ